MDGAAVSSGTGSGVAETTVSVSLTDKSSGTGDDGTGTEGVG